MTSSYFSWWSLWWRPSSGWISRWHWSHCCIWISFLGFCIWVFAYIYTYTYTYTNTYTYTSVAISSLEFVRLCHRPRCNLCSAMASPQQMDLPQLDLLIAQYGPPTNPAPLHLHDKVPEHLYMHMARHSEPPAAGFAVQLVLPYRLLIRGSYVVSQHPHPPSVPPSAETIDLVDLFGLSAD